MIVIDGVLKDSMQALSTTNIFVAPNIPESKLNKAIKAFGFAGKPDGIIALFDNTLFGAGTEGLLFAGDRVIYRATFAAPVDIAYDTVEYIYGIEKPPGKDGKKIIKSLEIGMTTGNTVVVKDLIGCDYEQLMFVLQEVCGLEADADEGKLELRPVEQVSGDANDIVEQVRQGDLYALLSLCTAEDLAPLVEIILSRPMNFLDIKDAYKTHKPHHTKYYKEIGDEMRLFGGHSIKNAIRGGEGPPYSEIVADVCKKLDVPYVKDDVVQSEANLFDIFFEQRWQSLAPSERQQFAINARTMAAGKASTGAFIGKAATSFAIGSLVSGPVAWAALGNKLLDANFKVTIPCVLHIAYLRRRLLEEWLEKESGELSCPEPETPEPTIRSDELVVAAADGEAVLSLARIPEPTGKAGWRLVGDSDDGISRLNSLLSAVPALTVAREFAGTNYMNYMKVVCNGALVGAKSGPNAIDGGFRAWSRGPGGITGQAVLFSPDKLAAMVNVSALMNVASIALAQKHLADISKRLGEIKGAIDGIRKFQNDQRRSKLTGSIRYFEQVAPAVLEGERPDRVLYQIEHHEAELLEVYEHLMEDIQGELEAVRNLKDDEWFGTGKTKSVIETHQRRIDELYRESILCLRARGCGWQLLCMFPGEEIGKEHRRRDIQKSLDRLAIDGEMLRASDALLRKKIHELSPFFSVGTTTNAQKLALLRANETLLVDIAACRAEVQSDLRAAEEMLVALRKPVSMVARIEDGKISAIKAL